MFKIYFFVVATIAIIAMNVYYLQHHHLCHEGFGNLKRRKYDDDQEDDDNNNNKSRIPKIIIQTWKDNYIPTRYEPLVKSVRYKNPAYKYIFFTDNDIETFLKKNYPQYYQTFLQLPVVIQKIDFFRYVAVYHYGGFYLDLDMQCLKSFDPLLDFSCVFPVDLHITNIMCMVPRFMTSCTNGEDIFVGQYAFGAEPRNEFVKILVDNIHNRIQHILQMYSQLQNKKDLQFVYSTTGPDYVTKQYYAFENRSNITILQHDSDQYFGKFAAHKAMGTWKGWI